MIEWMVFCEDQFHEKFVGQLIRRVAQESRLAVNLKFRTARGGLPRMQREFREFLRDLRVDCSSAPQGLVVVADANCKGYQERRKDLLSALDQFGKFGDRTAFAIPDPHIERWMMVDPHAFKIVFDEGCDPLPKIKCRKDEYKRLLLQQI